MAGSDLQTKLVCVECGEVAKGEAVGWRMYLTVDDEPVPYCDWCAEPEFGHAEQAARRPRNTEGARAR